LENWFVQRKIPMFNDEHEREAQGGEAKGPQKRREDGLTSTARE